MRESNVGAREREEWRRRVPGVVLALLDCAAIVQNLLHGRDRWHETEKTSPEEGYISNLIKDEPFDFLGESKT